MADFSSFNGTVPSVEFYYSHGGYANGFELSNIYESYGWPRVFYEIDASGGVIVSGVASFSRVFDKIASGETTISGVASFFFIANILASGGIIAEGSEINNTTSNFIPFDFSQFYNNPVFQLKSPIAALKSPVTAVTIHLFRNYTKKSK